MGRFKVVDQDNYEFKPEKELDKEDIVDRDSYIDPQEQIKNMIAAGERLKEFRKEQFDTMEDEFIEDPTRDVGYDDIDAVRDLGIVNERLAEQARIAKEKEEAEKANAEKAEVK